jgi:hypothetical protein
MLPAEVSVSLPPMVTPQRPRLIEYAAPNGGTGSLRCCRNSSSSWRLNGLVAHRRDDLEVRRQRAQRDFEAHLVVAGGGAAVRDAAAAELARHQRDGLRLHHALGADAQRIELAAAHVAHDQELQHLLEIVRARVDLVVLDGAQRLARSAGLGGGGVDAAGVHRHRDDRAP